MKCKIDYSLYLVTDRGMLDGVSLEDAVAEAIAGGCSLVQLREKEASSRVFYEQALRVKRRTDAHGVPIIINDRVDIALAVGAAGVHVGQDDLPLAAVRDLIGPEAIIGVSASTFDEAEQAVTGGADYLGVGAMYATDTKSGAKLTALDELARIRAAFTIPLVVIGGVNATNASLFRSMGVDGLAVVSAILSQPDIRRAARTVRNAFLEGSER